MKSYQLKMHAISQLSTKVFLVRLEKPCGAKLRFHAGQYLAVQRPDGEVLYFSIASTEDDPFIDLHVEVRSSHSSSSTLITTLMRDRHVEVKLPLGSACMGEIPENPVLLISSGTGFAQIHSLGTKLVRSGFGYPLLLFRNVREESDLYLSHVVNEWSCCCPNMQAYTIIRRQDQSDSTYLSALIEQLRKTELALQEFSVYVSGSARFVYSTRDALLTMGIREAAFYADALDFPTEGVLNTATKPR